MVYEILPDGCLNGVGSDTHTNTKNKIFNEVARKKKENNKKTIEGDYTTSYMNLQAVFITADLKISPNKGQYEFSWVEAGKEKYRGVGWKTRENQITVYYEYL